MTGGTDAQAEVTVRLEEDGKTVNGQGADVRHHRGVGARLCERAEQADGKRQKTAGRSTVWRSRTS